MQKSYLSAFHNDPKLNRLPQEKKIQPLFKKNFAGQAECLNKHLEDFDSHKKNLSETMHVRPTSSEVKIKTRNISNHRSENTSDSKENLEFLISKLRSEKLEVYSDLLTYEEKYQHKLCLRARIEEIKELCNELSEMSAIATDRLNVENDLFGYLQTGTLSMNFDQFCNVSSDEEEEEQEEKFLQNLIEISGIACICLSKLSENGTVSLSIYPYHFNQAVGADLITKATLFSLELDLYAYIFPYLSLSVEDCLKLKNTEINYGEFKFLIRLVNAKEPLETKISLKNNEIFIQRKNISIAITDFLLQDLLISNKKLEASAYIAKNLAMLVVDGVNTLAWQAKPWELEKYSVCEANSLVKLRCLELQSERFENFYTLLYCSFVKIYDLNVEFWKNSVSGCHKFILKKSDLSCVVLEETYKAEFGFLMGLQGFNFETQQKTIFNSLEFETFISTFILP